MVEVLMRHSKNKKSSELSDEDVALIQSKRILEEDYDFEKDKDFISYSYDMIIFDMRNISEIMRLDDNHVQVNKYNNTTWVIKMSYSDFKSLYTQLTGIVIMSTIHQKD